MEEVINNTVRRLAPADGGVPARGRRAAAVVPGARGEQLAAWVRAVLLHHAAFLAGGGGGSGTLGHLYQLIEARLASYQPLLALSGRLDLVLAHAKKAGAEVGTGGGGGVNGPLVTLQVGPGGEVEVEDAFAGAGLDSEEDDGYSEEESEEEGGDFEFYEDGEGEE